jgi:hypothetical protein
MDDFRVGSVPSAEPYGDRHSYAALGRRRQKHHDEEGHEEEEPADTFEASLAAETAAEPVEAEVKDYYTPSEPVAEEE